MCQKYIVRNCSYIDEQQLRNTYAYWAGTQDGDSNAGTQRGDRDDVHQLCGYG
jgi:hypothetical protein